MREISYTQEVLRKLIHLSSLWMVVAMILLKDYRYQLGLCFLICFILNVALEKMVICEVKYITPLYHFFFKNMLRGETEKPKWIISGGPPVWAAAALSSFLFPVVAGATALAIMLIADTCAALVGRKWGRHKTVNNKSIEGIIAFNIGGFICLLVITQFFPIHSILYYLIGIIGIFVASMAELFEKQLHVDDNFSIVLICGLFLSLGLYL